MPQINSYRFGKIVIDGKNYSKDVIIFPDHVMPNWWREQGHSLSVVDLQEVLTNPPEVLVVGTGAYGRMNVPSNTQKSIEEKGTKVIVRKTKQAVQAYREQTREKESVVAALHLTC